METRASYLLVGGFVLTLLLGTLGFLVWLVQAGDATPRQRYDVIYEGSVTGLREGGAVRLNGVRVGDVVSVTLDPQDPSKVRIGLAIAENVPIKQDTRAHLEMEGLTGGRYVLLTGSTPGSPPLGPTPGEENPIIAAVPSAIDQVLQEAPDVLVNINELLSRGNLVLSDQNIANITSTFADLAKAASVLEANSQRVESLLAGVEEALASLKSAGRSLSDFGDRVQDDAAALIRSGSQALQNISQLAEKMNTAFETASGDIRLLVGNVSAAADQFSRMVAENREPLRDFTAQGLFELVNFLAEARELVSGLRKITTEVERDPARFLFGDQQKGYEPNHR